MLWRTIAKFTKILGALAAVIVGVWAFASESSRPLVTDAVTNARLIEIFAPTDGKLSHIAAEGTQFMAGDELARTTPPESSDVETTEEVHVVSRLDDAATMGKTEYAFGIAKEGSTSDAAPVGLVDLRANPELKQNPNAETQPVRPTETSLFSETPGILWHWRGPSNAFFASGESVGFVAECLNLIAIGQAASSQTSVIRVGDPVLFVTEDTEWQGFVQRVVAGVPNLSGEYAIQFPFITADTSLLFFSLNGPAENKPDCALGVAGQIHYPLNARRSPYDVSVAVIGDVTALAYQTWHLIRTAAWPMLPDL